MHLGFLQSIFMRRQIIFVIASNTIGAHEYAQGQHLYLLQVKYTNLNSCILNIELRQVSDAGGPGAVPMMTANSLGGTSVAISTVT